MSAAPLLQVQQMQLGLADGTPLVDGVSWSLQPGQTLAVVGESGSGKSLSAMALMGLLPAAVHWHSGQALLQGQPLRELSPAQWRQLQGRRIGMVFQEPMTSLNPVMRVGEQVVEVLRCHLALPYRQARELAIELLGSVQIPQPEQRFAHYPHQLSGGQRQRVMIAMALACDPVLLLADEPTTALDVTVQADILQLIAEQQKRRGLGVVLITHDLGVVAQVADHVVVMYGGQVMEQGPAAQLLSAPGHPYTQGLLRARPSAHRPRSERLQEIPGIVAAPSRQRAGCPFAPRCASALPICAQQQPPAFELEAQRSSSCWLHHSGGGHG
jgi:oligopeptide/dipeptide ABC transporter ATP-binding protein